MCEEWPETDKIESRERFAEWLSRAVAAGIGTSVIYRGQAKSQWHLQPSLDRILPNNSAHSDRLPEEEKIIQQFCCQAFRFLGSLERSYIGNQGLNTMRMMVMQHFLAPTRLLDWTYSPAVAAYFACNYHSDLDGTIWWIDAKAVENYCTLNWPKWGIERHPPERGGQVVLDAHIFRPGVPEFVTLLDHKFRIPRAQAQRAMFTLGSRLGVDHDTVLAKELSEGQYGRITIKADVKDYALNYLEMMGIDAISLQYPGADRVGSRMAWELEQKAGRSCRATVSFITRIASRIQRGPSSQA